MAGPIDLLALLIAGVLVVIFVIKHDDSEIDFWQRMAYDLKERWKADNQLIEELEDECDRLDGEIERYKKLEDKYNQIIDEYNYMKNLGHMYVFSDREVDDCEISES